MYIPPSGGVVLPPRIDSTSDSVKPIASPIILFDSMAFSLQYSTLSKSALVVLTAVSRFSVKNVSDIKNASPIRPVFVHTGSRELLTERAPGRSART